MLPLISDLSLIVALLTMASLAATTMAAAQREVSPEQVTGFYKRLAVYDAGHAISSVKNGENIFSRDDRAYMLEVAPVAYREKPTDKSGTYSYSTYDDAIAIMDGLLADGKIPTSIPIVIVAVNDADFGGDCLWTNGHPAAIPTGKKGIDRMSIAATTGNIVCYEDLTRDMSESEIQDYFDKGWYLSSEKQRTDFYSGIDTQLHPELLKANEARAKTNAAKKENESGNKATPKAVKGDIKSFPDVPHNDWSYPYVSLASAYGYITGDEYGKFLPLSGLTGEAWFCIVTRALGVSLTTENAKFTDANSSFWSRKELTAADNLGLMKGLKTTDYKKPLSRYDMAVTIVNAANYLGIRNPGTKTAPGDVDSYYKNYVSATMSMGIITGYEDGSFGGDRTLARSESAAIIIRLMRAAGVINE